MTWQRISILIAPVVILLLFGSTLVGVDRLAFRDVSHFYLPLYDYVAFRTSGQWLPLWNPLDQTGIPLIGETTTAVLYPVRYVIFALPISSAVALAWYVVLHLILASLTARWAAIKTGASEAAAAIAGIIYPLSGGVLFLYTNPPFLVGAAWLPLVLGSLLGTRSMSISSRCLIASPAMAMMILGGDPQAALHTMLVGLAVGLVRMIRRDAEISFRELAIPLTVVPLIAGALTVPQLAASISWSSQSDRVRWIDQQPWYAPPALGGQRSDSFQFSLPPWHAAELITPNPSGHLFPKYQRLSALIPGDGRMWTPTIYAGLLGALAIISSVTRFRRQSDAWTAVAFVSLLLCMGHFGVVWLLQQIPSVLPGLDSAMGGPYWLLYQIVPGYDSFRYPVKWLPVFSLAIAVVTARWLDDPSQWATLRRWLLCLGIALVVGLAVTSFFSWQPERLNNIAAGRADRFWGPLDTSGAIARGQRTLVHSLLVLLGIATVFVLARRQRASDRLLVLAFLVAADLAFSGRAWIAKADAKQVDEMVESYRAERPQPDATRWLRSQSGGGWPIDWQRSSNPERITEVAASEQLAWFGRWHLADRQAVFNNMTSIRSHHVAMFWNACFQITNQKNAAQQNLFWRAVRDWLTIDGAATTAAAPWPYLKDNDGPRLATLVDAHLNHNARVTTWYRLHRTWDVKLDANVDDFARLLQSVADQGERAVPIVHHPLPVADQEPGQEEVELQIHVVSDNELQVDSPAAGLLTRPVFQDGHWHAEIKQPSSPEWKSVPVHQVSFLKQGVTIEAGHSQIRFRYHPWWLTWTLVLAALSWALLVWCAVTATLQRRRSVEP